jgi:hypothetical protein
MSDLTSANDGESKLTLRLRFSGLNLFVKTSSGYRVLVTDARARTNAPDRSVLHRHVPYLVVETGSLTVDGRPDDRLFRGRWNYEGRLKNRDVDFVELTGNFVFELSPAAENGDAVGHADWLPRLDEVEARVDVNAGLRQAPVAATFVLTQGQLVKGDGPKSAAWAGNHRGPKEPNELYEWTELLYIVSGPKITLERPGKDWILQPPAGKHEIIAWVGNAADADRLDNGRVQPGVGHRHGSHVLDHFKWLYEHAVVRPEPVTNLAHPVIEDEAVITTLTSTFCPDGQFP